MLENGPVILRFFKTGTVDDIESEERVADLETAKRLVLDRFPQAAFDRCCEEEPDGGCVFGYASESDLQQDRLAIANLSSRCKSGSVGAFRIGRWICLIGASYD